MGHAKSHMVPSSSVCLFPCQFLRHFHTALQPFAAFLGGICAQEAASSESLGRGILCWGRRHGAGVFRIMRGSAGVSRPWHLLDRRASPLSYSVSNCSSYECVVIFNEFAQKPCSAQEGPCSMSCICPGREGSGQIHAHSRLAALQRRGGPALTPLHEMMQANTRHPQTLARWPSSPERRIPKHVTINRETISTAAPNLSKRQLEISRLC